MKTLLIIGTGGFLGTVFRYLLSQFMHAKIQSAFPYGTLAVNISGCLLIGIVLALSERTPVSAEWRMFLATGICGGFTTFSAFSAETFSLFRLEHTGIAAAYVLSSVIGGLLATLAGYAVIKLF